MRAEAHHQVVQSYMPAYRIHESCSHILPMNHAHDRQGQHKIIKENLLEKPPGTQYIDESRSPLSSGLGRLYICMYLGHKSYPYFSIIGIYLDIAFIRKQLTIIIKLLPARKRVGNAKDSHASFGSTT